MAPVKIQYLDYIYKLVMKFKKKATMFARFKQALSMSMAYAS